MSTPKTKKVSLFQKIRRNTYSNHKLSDNDLLEIIPNKIENDTKNININISARSFSVFTNDLIHSPKIDENFNVRSTSNKPIDNTPSENQTLIKNGGTIQRFTQRFPDVNDALLDCIS